MRQSVMWERRREVVLTVCHTRHSNMQANEGYGQILPPLPHLDPERLLVSSLCTLATLTFPLHQPQCARPDSLLTQIKLSKRLLKADTETFESPARPPRHFAPPCSTATLPSCWRTIKVGNDSHYLRSSAVTPRELQETFNLVWTLCLRLCCQMKIAEKSHTFIKHCRCWTQRWITSWLNLAINTECLKPQSWRTSLKSSHDALNTHIPALDTFSRSVDVHFAVSQSQFVFVIMPSGAIPFFFPLSRFDSAMSVSKGALTETWLPWGKRRRLWESLCERLLTDVESQVSVHWVYRMCTRYEPEWLLISKSGSLVVWNSGAVTSFDSFTDHINDNFMLISLER